MFAFAFAMICFYNLLGYLLAFLSFGSYLEGFFVVSSFKNIAPAAKCSRFHQREPLNKIRKKVS